MTKKKGPRAISWCGHRLSKLGANVCLVAQGRTMPFFWRFLSITR